MLSEFLPMTLLSIIISVSLGSFGAWFMSRFAYRFGLLDLPNDRSSHNLPTPRGGGVGILAAYIVTSLLLGLPLLHWLPAGFLAVVSFFDDKLDLSPRGWQAVAVCEVVLLAGWWLVMRRVRCSVEG